MLDILKRKNVLDFKVIITVSKNENKYINFLVNKYGIPNQIELCGRLDKDQMNKFYLKSDILLFPSKLETWGLPIREAMSYNLPTLLASHPYAKATSNGYDKVSTKLAPNFLLRFIGNFNREAKSMRAFIGKTYNGDISSTKQIFNWEPISFEKTVLDTAKSVDESMKK